MFMEILWFLLGLVVGALTIYIWFRIKTRKMMPQQENPMGHSRQPGNYPAGAYSPSGSTNSPPQNPNADGSQQSKSDFEKLENMISNLQQTVGTLQGELTKIADSIDALRPNSEPFTQGRQNPTIAPDKTPRVGTAKVVHSQGRANAVAAYRKLSRDGLRDLPVEPLFVVLDLDSSARGSGIGETNRHFNQSESKQSAFVIFPEGEKEGWIFPNPIFSFTEAMKYVFPDLSYENFEEAKDRVEPQRVHSVSQGAWETVAT